MLVLKQALWSFAGDFHVGLAFSASCVHKTNGGACMQCRDNFYCHEIFEKDTFFRDM